jgi:molybdopterin-guanine dinucleotide biosynthesis adapter protein
MRPRGIPVIGFVAPSGSGKTTLLRQLIPILKRGGLRLGYLKHAHHRFDLDRPGKDSFEVRAAGADQTLLASSQRWALQVENPAPGADPDLGALLTHFASDQLDLVLAEGFKYAAYPKIEVHRVALGQLPLYPQDPDIIAVATDADLPADLPADQHPPILRLDDPPAIADFILAWLAAQGRSPD